MASEPRTLDSLWAQLWDDLRHNAVGKPSGEAIRNAAPFLLDVVEAAQRLCLLIDSGIDLRLLHTEYADDVNVLRAALDQHLTENQP